jgi:hypothetical protein
MGQGEFGSKAVAFSKELPENNFVKGCWWFFVDSGESGARTFLIQVTQTAVLGIDVHDQIPQASPAWDIQATGPKTLAVAPKELPLRAYI